MVLGGGGDDDALSPDEEVLLNAYFIPDFLVQSGWVVMWQLAYDFSLLPCSEGHLIVEVLGSHGGQLVHCRGGVEVVAGRLVHEIDISIVPVGCEHRVPGETVRDPHFGPRAPHSFERKIDHFLNHSL